MAMKPIQTTIICAIFLLFLAVLPAMGFAVDGTSNLHQVGIMPANTFNNFIWNDTLYNAEGYTIRCYNIGPGVNLSGLTYKKYIGEIIFEEKVQSLSIADQKLYTTTSNTFSIASLADKFHPVELGMISDSAYNFDDVVVSGNYAYVSGSHLSVFDISNPAHPTLVTSYGNQMGNLATDGKYLYGVKGGGNLPQLTIYDISRPVSPVYVSNLTFPNITNPTYGFSYIAYKNNTVYLPQFNAQNLFTIDVKDRSNPVVIDTKKFKFGQGPVGVDVSGNYLYVSIRYNGIRIYDISGRIPKLMGSNKISTGYSEEISSNGNVAAMATNSGGTAVYTTTNKSHPVLSTNLNVPSSAYVLAPTTIGSIDVLGHAGRNLGSWYWNITVPEETALSRPLTEWSIGSPRMFDMPWVGNYSYTAMGSNGGGAWIVNLTGLETPGFSPHSVSYNDYSNTLTYVATGSRIYTTGVNNFQIWDNTRKDTGKPALISSTPNVISRYSQLIPYHSHYLLAANLNTIKVVNIETDIPVVENTFSLGNYTLLKKSMSYDPKTEKIYILAELGGKDYVKAVDVADMKNIHWDTGSIKLGLQGRAITSNGTDVFVVGRNVGNGNMIMVSFANPATPVLVDHATSIDGDCDNTAFYKGYVYCGGVGAITIYKVAPFSTGIMNITQNKVVPGNQQPLPQPGSPDVIDEPSDVLDQEILPSGGGGGTEGTDMTVAPAIPAVTRVNTPPSQTSSGTVPTPWPIDSPTPASPPGALAGIGAVGFGFIMLKKR
jgi:hypothetical protein